MSIDRGYEMEEKLKEKEDLKNFLKEQYVALNKATNERDTDKITRISMMIFIIEKVLEKVEAFIKES